MNNYIKSKFTACLLFFFAINIVYAQVHIKGTFQNNSRYSHILIQKFDIGITTIASLPIYGNFHEFSYDFDEDIEPGVYRIKYSLTEPDKFFDVIVNGNEKEIAFKLDLEKNSFPKFLSSKENIYWYDNLSKKNTIIDKITLLDYFLTEYPNKEEKIFKQIRNEYNHQKTIYLKLLSTVRKTKDYEWASEMILNTPLDFSDPLESPRIQTLRKREKLWKSINTTNPKLINTPLYTTHILNYLSYWLQPETELNKKDIIEGLKNDIDTILMKFSDNEETLRFAYRYLNLGFNEIHEEEALKYLDCKYKNLAIKYLDTKEKKQFEHRMERYRILSKDSIAPDFSLYNAFGTNSKTLHSFVKKKTILVFWSTDCPFCVEELPRINEWAKTNSAIDVLAINIDNDSNDYLVNIKSYLGIKHCSEFKGWESDSVKQYFIKATPSYVVIDQDLKIVDSYSSWESCINYIN